MKDKIKQLEELKDWMKAVLIIAGVIAFFGLGGSYVYLDRALSFGNSQAVEIISMMDGKVRFHTVVEHLPVNANLTDKHNERDHSVFVAEPSTYQYPRNGELFLTFAGKLCQLLKNDQERLIWRLI